MTNALAEPPLLREGDLIAVVAPSSPYNLARLGAGMGMLRSWGLRVKFKPSVTAGLSRRDYLAGSDTARAADFMAAWLDPEVKGIFCARGGYGSQRILDLLDFDAIRRHPKLFVGSSDVTALHCAIWRRAGIVTFYGPMLEHTWTESSQESHYDTLMAERRQKRLKASIGVQTLVPGRARAPIVGGNLSLVASLVGTSYSISGRGNVVFLEDVGERPYRVDRMLWQLQASGVLDGAAAFLLGSFEQRPLDGNGSSSQTDFVDVLMEYLSGSQVPVLINTAYGHSDHALTLPMGRIVDVSPDGISNVTAGGV